MKRQIVLSNKELPCQEVVITGPPQKKIKETNHKSNSKVHYDAKGKEGVQSQNIIETLASMEPQGIKPNMESQNQPIFQTSTKYCDNCFSTQPHSSNSCSEIFKANFMDQCSFLSL